MLYALFLLQLMIIYFTSRFVMQKLFHALHRTVRSTSVSFYILSLLYLPGTLLHELSHLFTSIVLFVMPHSFDLIPKITELDEGKYYVRMGAVHHAATDPFRSMLIGAAPLFFGLGFFYTIFEFNLFPHSSILVNILILYLFVSISSSMFSSKQDMKESLMLVPFLLLIAAICVGFKIPVFDYLQSDVSLDVIKKFNLYIASATGLNMLLYFALRTT